MTSEKVAKTVEKKTGAGDPRTSPPVGWAFVRRRLFTPHDIFNVHKLLGLICEHPWHASYALFLLLLLLLLMMLLLLLLLLSSPLSLRNDNGRFCSCEFPLQLLLLLRAK